MRRILLALIIAAPLAAQPVRWSATTGNVSLSSAGTTATIQQPATNANQVEFETIVVYCSVACTVTQAANGAAATATAGTIIPTLPGPLNAPITAKFFTASNVGGGTAQGGAFNILAGGGTAVFCLNTSCGAAGTVALGAGGGGGNNYSVTISSITGTANVTFYGRSLQ